MTRRTPWAEYERAVRVYTEAGAAETVQRIVTAMSRLSRRLDVFYNERFDVIDISRTEWPVLQALAMEGRGGSSNPSRLADAAGVSASTMTHRLDRMVERGLVERRPIRRTAPAWWCRSPGPAGNCSARAVLDAESEESGIFAPLTDAERATLAALLEKALAAQDAEVKRRPR